MKNLKIFSIANSILLMLITSCVWAEDNKIETFQCNRTYDETIKLLQENDITVEQEKKLSNKQNEFICVGDDLESNFTNNPYIKNELQYYNLVVLKSMYLDNKNNPTSYAKLSIDALREHRLCLKNILNDIYDFCITDDSSSEAANKIQWITQALSPIFEFQIQKVDLISYLNFQRKQRSMLSEKFHGLSVRSSQYFLPLLSTFIQKVQALDGKLSNFLANPL